MLVPGAPEAPGAKTPPELILTTPTVPVPIRSPPPETLVKLELAIEPVTLSVPAITLVPPIYILAADSVSDPGPFRVSPQLPGVKTVGAL